MTTVLLGNDAPMMQTVDGGSYRAEHVNQSVTRVDMREGFDNAEEVELALSTPNDRMLTMIGRGLGPELRRYAIGILELEQTMAIHSGGAAPAWVSCDDEDFAKAIGKHFECPVGEPTAFITVNGRDALHGQHIATAAQPAAFSYMAVSTHATPSANPSVSTTLPNEIAVGAGSAAGGGLLRAQGTVAHTATTNTTTLSKTFTANANDTTPVTIAKIGIFNAASAGTLGYETMLNASATLTTSGDNVAITDTVTAG